jgi:hypothetical protein
LRFEILDALQESFRAVAALIVVLQPSRVSQQFTELLPHGCFQKLPLDLFVRADRFAAKPIAVGSAAPVINEIFHLATCA